MRLETKYKVGDKVLIKKKIDSHGLNEDNIKYINDVILKQYGGTIQTIEHCMHNTTMNISIYIIAGIRFLFTSDMFEDIPPELIDEL